MKSDPIRGKSIRWTFNAGPMANKTFEHTFEENGSVKWRPLNGEGGGAAAQYELAVVGTDVYAVSYLASSGYTLTVVLDFRTGQLVAFASNASELSMHHGSFEPAEGWTAYRKRAASEMHARH